MPLDISSALHSSISIPDEYFLFVRHGSTNWFCEQVDQGPQDLSLNEKGKQEAQLAAQKLESLINSKKNDYIIVSSTLKRAAETATIISEHLKIPIIFYANLKERYFGDYRLIKNQPTPFNVPPDAEEEAFESRILSAVNDIFNNDGYKSKRKILVSHGEVFKYLSKILTGKQQSTPFGGIYLFLPNKDGNFWTCYLQDSQQNI